MIKINYSFMIIFMFLTVSIVMMPMIYCRDSNSIDDNSIIGYMGFDFIVPELGLSKEESNILTVALDVHKILSSENNVNLIIKNSKVHLEKIWGNLSSSGIRVEFITSGDKDDDRINCVILKTPDQKLCSFNRIANVLFVTITTKNDESIYFIFHLEGYLQKVIHVNNQREQIGHHVQWDKNGKVVKEGVFEKPEKLRLFEVKGKNNK